MPIGMKRKVTRSISRGQSSDGRGFGWAQLSRGAIEPIGVNPILSQIRYQDKFALRIRSNHVRMGSIVPTDCITAWGRIGRLCAAQALAVEVNVRCGAE